MVKCYRCNKETQPHKNCSWLCEKCEEPYSEIKEVDEFTDYIENQKKFWEFASIAIKHYLTHKDGGKNNGS